MTDLREARAAAIRRRVGNGLADNLGLWLPLLLDDLDLIDEAHDGPLMVAAATMPEEAAEFAEPHPPGAVVKVLGVTPPTEQAAAPAKPARARKPRGEAG